MTGPFDYRAVPQWCLGANDHFGTCAYAAFANCLICWGGAPMMDGEIEHAASVMTGFIARDPSTDRGIRLEEMLTDIQRDGWPGDPELRIVTWNKIAGVDQIPAVIRLERCALAWCMLPDNNGWDWTDAALAAGVPGTGSHAVCLVEADADGMHLVSGAEVIRVSAAWWASYGRDAYRVVRAPEYDVN